MSANSKTQESNFRITSTLSPAISRLPDLSRYNNPATMKADLIRGIKWGRLAACKATVRCMGNFDEEADALDLAIEGVPLGESMSFAFLRGFAGEFRQIYQRRLSSA